MIIAQSPTLISIMVFDVKITKTQGWLGVTRLHKTNTSSSKTGEPINCQIVTYTQTSVSNHKAKNTNTARVQLPV